MVSLPHGYGHQRDGVRMGTRREVAGVSINDLTDPERSTSAATPRFSGVPVTVSAVGA